MKKCFLKDKKINTDNMDEAIDGLDLLLRRKGFDLNYNLTKIGTLCESMLDKIADAGY